MKIKIELTIESNEHANEHTPADELETALRDDFEATLDCADLFGTVGEINYTVVEA